MILALVLSLGVGLSLGVLGGGGSVLTLPILVYLVGLETKSAIATSLLVVGVTSLAALIPHARAGRVRFRVGALFGLASMAGAFAGGRIAHRLPATLLLAGFTGVMLVTGAMMLRPRSATVSVQSPRLRTAVVGVAIGLMTGVVGAGGGFVVVPALAMLCGLSIGEAMATSLLVIAMNSLAGFAGYVGHVPVDARIATMVTLAAVVGSIGGALLARRAKPESLRRAFALLVLSMGAWMVHRQIPSLPLTPLIGGAIIGASASLLLLLNGRVAGISGIVAGLVKPIAGETSWRAYFVVGLLLGGVLLMVLRPSSLAAPSVSLGAVVVSGLLVGFGTRLGSGCTSGHGVCGISRGSLRSVIATLTFMSTGAVAAFVVHHLGKTR